MMRGFRFIVSGLVCVAQLAGAGSADAFSVAERRSLQKETLLMLELLQGHHYAGRQVRDLDAAEFIDAYLKALDPRRLYLTTADATFLHRRFDRNLKTIYLFKGDLHPAFEIFDLVVKRVEARTAWIGARLERPFLFGAEDRLDVDRTKAERPADEAAADALWEKWLANELIGERALGRDEAGAAARVRARHERFARDLREMDGLRVREVFLNELLQLADAHSGYFSRESADEFATTMAGGAVGIGVELRQRDGKFFVEALQAGGAAGRAGGLLPDDEVLAIAEADGDWRELAGRRMREVAGWIRGEPDTVVNLRVREPGGQATRELALTRRRTEWSEARAQGAVIRVPADGGKEISVGLLSLPAFYGSKGETSATDDVRELLAVFRAKGVEAVVLDLRDNGGGLINEAVGLAGLFIKTGPVILVRDGGDRIETLRDDDDAVAFAGPLVVLTSSRSASASEALAGALQAHGRALVVGDAATFGKGSVQAYIGLREASREPVTPEMRAWGTLRLTRQRFYHPDGNGPQWRGVKSDLELPGQFTPSDADGDDEDDDARTERALPHALAWDRLEGAIVPAWTPPANPSVTAALKTALAEASTRRRTALPEFVIDAKWRAFRAKWTQTDGVSLDGELRRKTRDESEAEWVALRDEREAFVVGAVYPWEQVELAPVAAATEAEQKRLADALAGAKCRVGRRAVMHRDAHDGRCRETPFEQFDIVLMQARAASLAAAWSAVAKEPMSADEARTALTALKLAIADRAAGFGDYAGLAAVFRGALGGRWEGTADAPEVAAFFEAMIAADPAVRRDRAALDVPLRESLRVAADWVRLAPADRAADAARSDTISTP